MRTITSCLLLATTLLLVGCGADTRSSGNSTSIEIGPQGIKVDAPGTKVDVSPESGIRVDAPGADVRVGGESGVEVKTRETETKVAPKDD